jgi:hypothetical protein
MAKDMTETVVIMGGISRIASGRCKDLTHKDESQNV